LTDINELSFLSATWN